MPRSKKGRRAPGEGSVFQRKDGRWVMQIWTGSEYKQKYVKSQKEGFEKLRQAQRELEQGILPTQPDQMLEQYLEYWIEEVHKPTIKLSSYVKYRKLIRLYILPELGKIKLQKLTPQHINSLYRKMEKRGLKPKTINSVHGLLHKALDNAVKWGYMARNVCDSVSPPRLVKTEIQPLTMEQAHKLLEAVRGHRLETLLTLALTTGMRRGELLALRWSDVDLEQGSIHVRRTVDHIPKYGYVETEPKTKNAQRLIMLPAFVVDTLKQHRMEQQEQRLKAGDNWQDLNLVFTGLHGNYLNPRYLPKMFSKVLMEAGLPHIRFHDLRHSAATILLSMGVQLKVVQEILGHSTIVMTADIYSHVLPSIQKEAMEKWEQRFRLGERDVSDEGE
jgi:integrase